MGREVEELRMIFLGSKDSGDHFWPSRIVASSFQELLTNHHHPCKNYDRIFREITTTIIQGGGIMPQRYSLPGAQKIHKPP